MRQHQINPQLTPGLAAAPHIPPSMHTGVPQHALLPTPAAAPSSAPASTTTVAVTSVALAAAVTAAAWWITNKTLDHGWGKFFGDKKKSGTRSNPLSGGDYDCECARPRR